MLHQLLGVLRLPEVQRGVLAASGLPGPSRAPKRTNGSFEDYRLADRRLMLAQLARLTGEWPQRFIGLLRVQGLTRRLLVTNMKPVPAWYDEVAEELSQRNGKRPRKAIHLQPHLTLQQMRERHASATTKLVRERWGLLPPLPPDGYTLSLGGHQAGGRR